MEYFAYSQKAFVYKYVVMMSDTDQFKHMSFANYLKLMFLATDALFVSAFDAKFLETSRLKSLNSRMQFKKQTVAGENVLIKINATCIEENMFSLLHTFVIEGSADLVVLGRQTYQLCNLEDQAPKALVDRVRDLLVPIVVDEENLVYKY